MAAISQTIYIRCIIVNQKFCILIKISLKFVPYGPVDNKSTLVQVMANIWTNADPVHRRIYSALGGYKFNIMFEIVRDRFSTMLVSCRIGSVHSDDGLLVFSARLAAAPLAHAHSCLVPYRCWPLGPWWGRFPIWLQREVLTGAVHYSDVIMGAMAFQITDCLPNRSFRRRSKKTSVSLAFVRGIHRSPVNFPHKGPGEDVSIWWRHLVEVTTSIVIDPLESAFLFHYDVKEANYQVFLHENQ